MKTINLLILLLFPVGLAVAQEPEFICATELSETQNKQLFNQMLLTNNDGQFLTANGTLKILVVFAEFENYNEEDTKGRPGGYWPDGGFPSFVNSYIDSTVTQNSTHKLNITNYFSQMSQGNYKVIGDVKTVHVPNNYVNNRSGANQWVLNHLDNEVDYSEYDNWTKNADFIHTNTPDGIVDMIVIIYRGKTVLGNAGGEASLGFNSIMVDNGSTEIKGRFTQLANQPTKGSGVTAQIISDSPEYDMISVTHEISHWLLGPHPYKSNGPIISRYPSMLQGSWYYASSTNAYEAERLGWITPTAIDSSIGDVSGLELNDFLTTGDAVRIKVTGGRADEYYLLENRQHVSIYDNATQNDSDKGLFIHHVRGHYSSSTDDFRMLPSFGNWDWTTDGITTVSGSTVSIMKKNEPNHAGLSFHEPLPGVSGDEWMHAYRDDQNNLFTGGIFRGNDVISSYNDNKNPLFASITNPRSTTWSGSNTEIAVKVVDEDQGKITVDVLMEYDPYTITENTTWDGQIFLDQTTIVDNNATLTILPGTAVYLADNVSIYIQPGSTLLAEGTQSKPIKFIRADVNNDWGRIALYSSAGNSIKWALFDGGYINLSIASKNNTIAHSTFRNASFRTIEGWHNQDGSGNASATISHTLIENSATVGLVSHYLDLDLSYTTIRNNTQAGLYALSNSVKPFHHNKITGNGGTSRDGVEVMNSGTLYMYGQGYGPGYNEIHNNGDDQVSTYGDLFIGEMGPSTVIGGYNSIYGNYSGFRYLVYNGSSATVQAEYVWWGQYPVQSGMTSGYIQLDQNMQTSDPTVGQNPGAGDQVPAKIRGGNSTEQDIISAYDNAELALGQAETDQQAIDEVYALYQLAGISENKELKDRFNVLIQVVAQANRAVYSTQQKNNLIQDYAKVLYAKALIRDEHYGQAQEWLQEGDFSRLTGKDQQDYLHLRMVTEVYHGSYETALSTLEQLYALEQTQGEDIEALKARYSTFEEDIVIRLKEKGGGDNRSEKLTERAEEQQEFGLQNYPNPFNPTTNINFTIPQKGMVSLVVYDVLGREVATLVSGTLPAGKQSIRFDASNLANGMYLYKLRVNNQEIVRKMTLIK